VGQSPNSPSPARNPTTSPLLDRPKAPVGTRVGDSPPIPRLRPLYRRHPVRSAAVSCRLATHASVRRLLPPSGWLRRGVRLTRQRLSRLSESSIGYCSIPARASARGPAGPIKPPWRPLPVIGGIARLGPGGVLAGCRRAARRKWHAHRQRTPTRAAKRCNLVLPSIAWRKSHMQFVDPPLAACHWSERGCPTGTRHRFGVQEFTTQRPRGSERGDGGADVATMLPS